MTKRPFDFMLASYKQKIERDRKTYEFAFSQADTFVTWLIGFAFTGLILLIGNWEKFIRFQPFKLLVVLLTITIILGIAFRYISFLVILFEKGLDDYYFGVFSESGMYPYEWDDQLESSDYETILFLLKSDFKEEIPYPRTLTEDEKRLERPKLIAHYKRLCAFARRDMEKAMEYISEIEATAHHIPKEENMAHFEAALKNPKIGYAAKKWSFVRSWIFTLCLLCFLAAMLTVSIALLFT